MAAGHGCASINVTPGVSVWRQSVWQLPDRRQDETPALLCRSLIHPSVETTTASSSLHIKTTGALQADLLLSHPIPPLILPPMSPHRRTMALLALVASLTLVSALPYNVYRHPSPSPSPTAVPSARNQYEPHSHRQKRNNETTQCGCTPGEYRCVGAWIQQCGQSGGVWISRRDCGLQNEGQKLFMCDP